MEPTANRTADNPKPNLPLILGGVTLGLILLAMVGGLVAIYVANFNLLSWLE
jgi:hypothetical protein